MASMTTVRTCFAIGVRNGLPIIHCDIPSAFLQSAIDVPQYLMLPKGITIKPSTELAQQVNTTTWDNRVVKLLRSIYGLKSAPQLFNKLLTNCLEKDLKMTRASSDACMYYSRNDTGWVLLCTEVDDLIITGTDEGKIQEIRKYFEAKFKMKDWDTPVRSFLGININ